MKKTFTKKYVFVIITFVFLLKKHMRDAKILAISNIPKHNQTTEEFKHGNRTENQLKIQLYIILMFCF